MQLKDVMTRRVEVVSPEASLEQAARKMDELNVGPLPVCDGERLVGMVTDRDITVRASAAGKDPRNTMVREAMTKEVLYCFEDQDVREAARLMEDKQVRRVPVLDRSKRLVGIVSLGDLATETHDQRLSGEVLTRVSEPAEPDR
jgi:CBS domain-containing protein